MTLMWMLNLVTIDVDKAGQLFINNITKQFLLMQLLCTDITTVVGDTCNSCHLCRIVCFDVISILTARVHLYISIFRIPASVITLSHIGSLGSPYTA